MIVSTQVFAAAASLLSLVANPSVRVPDDDRRLTISMMESAALRTLRSVPAAAPSSRSVEKTEPWINDSVVDAWGYLLEVELVLAVVSGGSDGVIDGQTETDDRVQRTLLRTAVGEWQTSSPMLAISENERWREPRLGPRLFVSGDPYKKAVTNRVLLELSARVASQAVSTKSCPALEEFSHSSYLDEGRATLDGWGKPMRVSVEAAVRSNGADGKRGGTGDAADLEGLYAYVSDVSEPENRSLVAVVETDVRRNISGLILDGGKALTWYRVVIVQDDVVVKTGETDASGRYYIKRLPAGEFWLCVQYRGAGAGYGIIPLARVVVEDGEWAAKDFHVRAGSIKGRATRSTGEACAKCDITIEWKESAARGFTTRVRVDSTGEFMLRLAPIGSALLSGNGETSEFVKAIKVPTDRVIDVGTVVVAP